MIIKINQRSEIPLYLQLRNQIVTGIGKGALKPGESLPTVRQLATDLGINSMTVSKHISCSRPKDFWKQTGAAVASSRSLTQTVPAQLPLLKKN